jgi:hypothetical protein
MGGQNLESKDTFACSGARGMGEKALASTLVGRKAGVRD